MSAICSFEGAKARTGPSGPIWTLGYRNRIPFVGLTVHGAPLQAIQAIRRSLGKPTTEHLVDEMTVEFTGGPTSTLFSAPLMAQVAKGLYMEGAVCVGGCKPNMNSPDQLHFTQIPPPQVDRDAAFFTLSNKYDSINLSYAPQEAVIALRGALAASGVSVKKEKFKPEQHTTSFIYSAFTNMTGLNGKLSQIMGRVLSDLQSAGFYLYASTGAPCFLDVMTFCSLVPAIQSHPCASWDPPPALTGTGPLCDVPLGSRSFWAIETNGKFTLKGAFPFASQSFEGAVKKAGATITSVSADPEAGDYVHGFTGDMKPILLHWVDLLAEKGVSQIGAARTGCTEDGSAATGMQFGEGFSIQPGTVLMVECSDDSVYLRTCGLEAHGNLAAEVNLAMGQALKKSWRPERGIQLTSEGYWKMHGSPFSSGLPPTEWGGKVWFAIVNSLQSLGFHQIGKYGGPTWQSRSDLFFFARPLR